jgi:hypothetical protein
VARPRDRAVAIRTSTMNEGVLARENRGDAAAVNRGRMTVTVRGLELPMHGPGTRGGIRARERSPLGSSPQAADGTGWPALDAVYRLDYPLDPDQRPRGQREASRTVRHRRTGLPARGLHPGPARRVERQERPQRPRLPARRVHSTPCLPIDSTDQFKDGTWETHPQGFENQGRWHHVREHGQVATQQDCTTRGPGRLGRASLPVRRGSTAPSTDPPPAARPARRPS